MSDRGSASQWFWTGTLPEPVSAACAVATYSKVPLPWPKGAGLLAHRQAPAPAVGRSHSVAGALSLWKASVGPAPTALTKGSAYAPLLVGGKV